MTRKTDCGKYLECLQKAARADLWEIRCDVCGDYTPIEQNPTTADLAGALALILAVLNPDLAEQLPQDRLWRWDLLELFQNIRERNDLAGADHQVAGHPAR